MADNPKVKGIKYGTMQQYLHQEIDKDMLYFITDKGLLYRGSQIVVPTKFIDVEPNEDVHHNAYYTFTIEAYADDPEHPETLTFDVWSKAAVTALIKSLSLSLSNHYNATASDTVKGHTYLSDATDSNLNAATGGTAATPLAVKNAVAAANAYTDEQIAGIVTGASQKGTYGLVADGADETRPLNEIPALHGDTYICISNMTGVAYTNGAGISIANATLAPGDNIICLQDAVVNEGTVTTPARWTIVPNTASNAVTTNETLTDGSVIVGNGNKTVRKLAGGNAGDFVRKGQNGKAEFYNHTNLDHGIAYGVCASDPEPQATMVVEIGGITLQPYAILAVKFVKGVGDGAMLDVNEDSRPIPIIFHNEPIPNSIINKEDTATLMLVPDFIIKEEKIIAWVVISIDRAPSNMPTSLSAFTNDIQGLGTCSTGYGTQQKQVTMSGVTINKGSIFAVRFTNPVGAGATMKVNQQAVKAIKHRNLDITTGQILGGDTATFIYDGSYYHLLAVDRPIDTAPTAGSHNMVESNGIYNMIQSAIAESTLYWEEMQ